MLHVDGPPVPDGAPVTGKRIVILTQKSMQSACIAGRKPFRLRLRGRQRSLVNAQARPEVQRIPDSAIALMISSSIVSALVEQPHTKEYFLRPLQISRVLCLPITKRSS